MFCIFIVIYLCYSGGDDGMNADYTGGGQDDDLRSHSG